MLACISCRLACRTAVLVALLVAATVPAAASATTLMTEDSGVLSDKWLVGPGVTPHMVDIGYNVAGYIGAKRIRYHRGLEPWEINASGDLVQENLPRAYDLYYSRVDSWLSDVERRGFKPYLTLVYQPGFWRFPTNGSEELDLVNKFRSFCGNVATRYRGRISEFGVWNEPNNAVWGRGLHTEYGRSLYNTLYRNCYAAVKAANPSAKLYYGEIDAHKPNGCNYVYHSLWHPTVADGVAIHTYQWKTAPETIQPGSTPCQGIGRLSEWNTAKQSWASNGKLKTPQGGVPALWITEHGYCRLGATCVQSGNGLDEATRANFTRRAYLWAQSHGVEVFSYYHLFETGPSPSGWDSGILSRSGSASATVFSLKPATLGHGRLFGESDVHGDGRADLVTLHSTGTAYVYPGRFDDTYSPGVGTFSGSMDPAQYDGVGHYVIDVADVTGDHRDDLITLLSSGTACVYPGQPSNHFAPSCVASFGGTMKPALLNPNGHEPIAVADVNGDHRDDLVTFDDRQGNVYVYLGESNGTFVNSASSFGGTMNSALHDGQGHYFLDVSDVNGDGRADLVTLASWGTAYVYPGRPDGTFGVSTASFGGGMNPVMDDGSGHEPIGVGDVTGDRRNDLVTVKDGTVRVYPAKADGSFGEASASFHGTMDSSLLDDDGHELIGVTDVNGDGYADLITLHKNGSSYLYRGLPSGVFGTPGIPSFSGTLHSSRFGRSGHEFALEKPFWRRRGCSAGGCH